MQSGCVMAAREHRNPHTQPAGCLQNGEIGIGHQRRMPVTGNTWATALWSAWRTHGRDRDPGSPHSKLLCS